MSRLATLVTHDARLQLRYGIYYAYTFVVAFYACLLVFAAPWLPAWVPGTIIYTDPAAVGFFFLGALIMLEKGEGTRSALAITPVSASDYFAAKATTLTGLSFAAVAILAILVHTGANLPLLLAANGLTSLAYLGLGVPVAFRFKTVTSYLIGAAGWLTPVILPAGFAFLDPMPAWAMILPPAAQFRLILVASGYGGASPLELTIMLAVCALTAAGCVWLALRRLKREFGA